MTAWEVAVAAVVGFLLGSVNPALIIARARGIDLRGAGSGNPGATNAGRIMGRRTGVIVAAADVLKGFVPAVVASLLWGVEIGMVAGFAAVLGHVLSPFLRFRGGKGVATAAGAILGTQPLWLLPALLVFWLTFALVRRMAVASIVTALALVPIALLFRAPGYGVLFMAALAVVILLRHWRNIAELLGVGRPDAAAGGAAESASGSGNGDDEL